MIINFFLKNGSFLDVEKDIFTNFGAVYLTQFLTDLSQILDSKSSD